MRGDAQISVISMNILKQKRTSINQLQELGYVDRMTNHCQGKAPVQKSNTSDDQQGGKETPLDTLIKT